MLLLGTHKGSLLDGTGLDWLTTSQLMSIRDKEVHYEGWNQGHQDPLGAWERGMTELTLSSVSVPSLNHCVMETQQSATAEREKVFFRLESGSPSSFQGVYGVHALIASSTPLVLY